MESVSPGAHSLNGDVCITVYSGEVYCMQKWHRDVLSSPVIRVRADIMFGNIHDIAVSILGENSSI